LLHGLSGLDFEGVIAIGSFKLTVKILFFLSSRLFQAKLTTSSLTSPHSVILFRQAIVFGLCLFHGELSILHALLRIQSCLFPMLPTFF